jgi:hypothetical protein
VLVALLLLELAVRFGLPHFNSNMRRFRNELAAASRMGQKSAASRTSILFLGNSLTLTDIDVNRMQVELAGVATVGRWAVDDTNYLDWLFGLRRVFHAGGRPGVVVVGGKSGHFLASHVRGQFFAHYVLDGRDLVAAASRTGSDANGFCNMAVAHLSAFYGSREEVYKRTLTLVLPGFRGLARALNKGQSLRSGEADLHNRAAERLAEMRFLCASHGAQLVLWLPPTPGQDRNANVILETGMRKHVPVLVPVADGEIPSREYPDGFHLSPSGAHTNTIALARALRSLLAIPAAAGNGPPGGHVVAD